MRRTKRDPRERLQPPPRRPGYSFGDLLVLTEATRSNLQHWMKTEVIKAEIDDREGKGHHRRFSTMNVVEVQLAFAINKFGLPVETIRHALWVFRDFRRAAIAIHEHLQEIPLATTPGLGGMFRDEDDRRRVGESYVRSHIAGHKLLNEDGVNRARDQARAIGENWHRLRTASLLRGEPDVFWANHFYGLFISKEADANWRDVASIHLDPTLTDLHDLIGSSAVVVSLPDVLWTVGQRAKWPAAPLDPW